MYSQFRLVTPVASLANIEGSSPVQRVYYYYIIIQMNPTLFYFESTILLREYKLFFIQNLYFLLFSSLYLLPLNFPLFYNHVFSLRGRFSLVPHWPKLFKITSKHRWKHFVEYRNNAKLDFILIQNMQKCIVSPSLFLTKEELRMVNMFFWKCGLLSLNFGSPKYMSRMFVEVLSCEWEIKV